MTSPLLVLNNVTKNFPMGGDVIQALKSINLTLNASESLSVTGPSGAGKSTLLHIIGGLERPSSGEAFFDGRDIYALSKEELNRYLNREVGFVFQFHYLLDDFTALENITIPALLAGEREREAKVRANELLVRVGLEGRASHYPKELSGGEQQRVALARAVMNKPRLILADEPTGSLDRQNSAVVRELLFSFLKDGAGLILVTHDQELALEATRTIKLEK